MNLLIERFLSFFPIIRCPICGGVKNNGFLCELCAEKIESLYVQKGYCIRCGEPLTSEKLTWCGECLTNKRPWDYFSFYGYYRDILRQIITEFKYRGDFACLGILQGLLCKAYLKADSDFDPDIIIPVPIHKNRLKLRGFNQSLEISRKLSRLIGVPIERNILVRTKDTVSQVGLKKSEREKNVKNVFCVIGDIKGINIVLVDDVYTSGATASECSKVLKAAGAGMVGVLVVARTKSGDVEYNS